MKDNKSEDIIELLSVESSQPNPIFRDELRRQVLQRAAGQSTSQFISQNNNMDSIALLFSKYRYQLMTVTGVCLVVLVLAIVWLLPQGTTPNDDDQVLASIFSKYQPATANDGSERAAADDSLSAESGQSTMPTALPYIPALEDKQYNFSEIKYSFGPKSGQCEVLYVGENLATQVTERYVYEGQMFISTHGKTADGQTLDYYLDNDQGGYQYKGGSYALFYERSQLAPVPMIEPAPAAVDEDVEDLPMPDKDVVVDNPRVEDDQPYVWYPEDAQLRQETKDGKQYNVVTWTDEWPCDPAVFGNHKQVTHELWADVETNEIKQERYYLGSATEANLIVQTEMTAYEQQRDYADVQNVFKFPFSVEVKEIDIDAVKYYGQEGFLDQLNNFLRGNDSKVLQLQDEQLSYMHSSQMSTALDPREQAMRDRAYYPAGSIGQAGYDDYMRQVNSYPEYPLLTLDYNGGDRGYLTVTSYSGVIAHQDIAGGGEGIEQSRSEIAVGDEQVAGDLYTYSYSIGRAEKLETVSDGGEGSSEAMPVDPIDSQRYMFVFDYQGVTYVIESGDQLQITEGKYQVIDATNRDELESFISSIPNSIKERELL